MTDELVNKLRTTKLFEAGEWESGLGLEAADRIEQDAATIARLEGEREYTQRILNNWQREASTEKARAERLEAALKAERLASLEANKP